MLNYTAEYMLPQIITKNHICTHQVLCYYEKSIFKNIALL